ncbi:MAG: aminoacyl-tRNA hydrolase [Gammaproteobacteria bacterium]|nr:aminoacyl-tRNA hydrolase [Gammaproteobacteria bacterium]
MGWFDWLLGRRDDAGVSEDAIVQLIVGLGNPGGEYDDTRHNAGFWLVDELARRHGGMFNHDKKFFGEQCQVSIEGHNVRLLKPMTYMNRSGQSVRALASYLKVPLEKILVAHDEIDLPPGEVRLKQGGGHGGHNGLRDISSHLGRDFARLRLGVGHPGNKNEVTDYVLKRPSRDDAAAIDDAVRAGADIVPFLITDGFQKAMHKLHTK